jgi:hypothetical protein
MIRKKQFNCNYYFDFEYVVYCKISLRLHLNFFIIQLEICSSKPEQSYDTAVNLPFKPLQTASDLHTSVPNYEGFLWLRHDFTIPSSFANMPLLGVLLGRIMIADETYFNGELIGSTGQFPPNFFSEWNKYRLYMLPKSLLKVNEENILLIKFMLIMKVQ